MKYQPFQKQASNSTKRLLLARKSQKKTNLIPILLTMAVVLCIVIVIAVIPASKNKKANTTDKSSLDTPKVYEEPIQITSVDKNKLTAAMKSLNRIYTWIKNAEEMIEQKLTEDEISKLDKEYDQVFEEMNSDYAVIEDLTGKYNQNILNENDRQYRSKIGILRLKLSKLKRK